MDIAVLAKWVPDPDGAPPEVAADGLLTRSEAGAALDSSDEIGIELAVRLVEDSGGCVTTVSVGPEPAVAALRRALASGAEAAVHVCDDNLRGADTLATARVLAAVLRRRPYDLVVAGVESTDGGTGTMPIALAELLGVPAATFARRVDVDGGVVTIERQTAVGYDVVACDLPALVTVTAAAALPRHPSLRDLIRARKHDIETLSLADLGLTADDLQTTQRVTAIAVAPARPAGEVVDDETVAPDRILRILTEAGALR
jgi:electron transfer flavoprotein beta subunit